MKIGQRERRFVNRPQNRVGVLDGYVIAVDTSEMPKGVEHTVELTFSTPPRGGHL